LKNEIVKNDFWREAVSGEPPATPISAQFHKTKGLRISGELKPNQQGERF